MNVGRILLVAVTLLAASYASAVDPQYLRDNVLHFLQRSFVSAHVQIMVAVPDWGMRDLRSGRVGYRSFKITARVIEGFKNAAPGPVEFYVTQEQPSEPPQFGEYIVSLDQDENGQLFFADDSVFWVDATPELLRSARNAR